MEGILPWMRIPDTGCLMLVGIKLFLFYYLSFLVGGICLFRSIAVSCPYVYKSIAKRGLIVGIILTILLLSVSSVLLLIFTNLVDVKYVGPPDSAGCVLFLTPDSRTLFFALFISANLTLNLLFLATYLTLHYKFKSVITTSTEMMILKRGALFITAITTSSYFICYTPILLVYLLMSITPGLVESAEPPVSLILGFVMNILPQANSCILPLFLVSGKTLERLGMAAKVTQRSVVVRERHSP